MSAAVMTVAVDPTTQKVLLILAALLVGSSVGLLGALVFGVVARGRARPPRAAAVRMQPPAVTRAPWPPPLADAAPAAPAPFVAPGIGSVPALFALDSDAARDRHRELYDAEYAKQIHHLDRLRRTVGTRMAVGGELHKPSEESDA